MCPGVRTRIGSIFIARSSDANSTLPSTQLICEDSSAASNVRTRCEKTTLLERLVLETEL